MVVPHTAWSLTSSIQVSALVFKVSGNACGVRLGQGHTMGHCPRTRGDKQSWVRQVSNHSIPRLKSLIRCCCSVTQSCSTFCDPMDCSTPGFPVLYYLPLRDRIHWVYSIDTRILWQLFSIFFSLILLREGMKTSFQWSLNWATVITASSHMSENNTGFSILLTSFLM